MNTNKKAITLTRTKFIDMLLNWEKTSFSGVAFANVVYLVDEAESKTVKGKKQLQKLVRTNITLGAQYEAKVQRIQAKQGETADFKTEVMIGKEYIEYPKPVARKIKDPNVKYMVMMIENHTKPDRQYFHNGKMISKEKAIAMQLFTPSYFTPKQTAGRGEVDESNNFFFRTLNVQNLLRIHVGGKILKLVD